jgi:hypothetical protein
MSYKISSLGCVVSFLCMITLTIACVDEQRQPPAPQVSQAEDHEADMNITLPSSLEETSAVSPNSCLTVEEGCQAGCTTCGVRCCDLTLVRFFGERCGSCRTDAELACANHGGPLHIRWCGE